MSLLVDSLATYRLTQLSVHDKIADPVREAIRQRGYIDPPPEEAPEEKGIVPRPGGAGWRWLHELVICPWCVGFWFACIVTVLRATVPERWQWPAHALAASGVTGFLAEH